MSGGLVLRTFAENREALDFWSDLGFRPGTVQMVGDLWSLAAPAALARSEEENQASRAEP